MKAGLGISFAVHATALFMITYGGVDSPVKADKILQMESIDVEILSESEYVAVATPVPDSKPAPKALEELVHYTMPEIEFPTTNEPDIQDNIVSSELKTLNMMAQPTVSTEIEPIAIQSPNIVLAYNQKELAEVNIGFEEGMVEEISLYNSLNLELGDALKLPEVPRVSMSTAPYQRPDVKLDDAVAEASAPDVESKEKLVPAIKESTAPIETTLKIVTEATKAENTSTPVDVVNPNQLYKKLLVQGRPVARPANLAIPIKSKDEAESNDIELKLRQAILVDVIANDQEIKSTSSAKSPELKPPEKIPLTSIELNKIDRMINQEWNIGTLSSAAQRVVITVKISLSPDGYLIKTELIDTEGGSGESVDQAYAAARRAIYQGLEKGIGLPKSKYEQWKVIEITFNPAELRKL